MPTKITFRVLEPTVSQHPATPENRDQVALEFVPWQGIGAGRMKVGRLFHCIDREEVKSAVELANRIRFSIRAPWAAKFVTLAG